MYTEMSHCAPLCSRTEHHPPQYTSSIDTPTVIILCTASLTQGSHNKDNCHHHPAAVLTTEQCQVLDTYIIVFIIVSIITVIIRCIVCIYSEGDNPKLLSVVFPLLLYLMLSMSSSYSQTPHDKFVLFQ